MDAKGPRFNINSENQVLVATGLMVIAAILVAADSIMVRLLTQDLHPFVIAFFRSLFGLVFVAPMILRNHGVLRSRYTFLHLLRAGLKLVAIVSFFIAIKSASLSDVTTIAFTTPLFVTIGAWLLLGERPVPIRIASVVLGFFGVLVIFRPGQEAISVALMFALLGAVLTSVIQLMLKQMSASDTTDTLVAWNLLLIVPLSLLPAMWFWTTPTLSQLALLALQGGAGALSMTLITRSLSLAEASYLAPIDFLRLPAVAILAFLFFGEIPTIWTLVGAAIIFGSMLLAARSNRV